MASAVKGDMKMDVSFRVC